MSAHSVRIREILDATTAAQARFSAALAGISDSAAQLPGPRDGWSAAEIAMHVAITNEWIAGVLNGEIQSAKPAPPSFREDWSGIVIPDRLQTFPALQPPQGVTRQQAVNRLAISDDRVRHAIYDLDPVRARYVVIFPFGTLSLYQVGEFAGMHTNRHMMQLQRLQVEVTTG